MTCPFAAGDMPWPEDPLMAAVVWKLPKTGTEFSAEQRVAWLKLMAMAFDVAYGALEQSAPELLAHAIGAQRDPPVLVPRELVSAAPTAAPPPKHAGYDFYVTLDGTVCDAKGNPVLVGDVPADETIFDYRPVTGDFRDVAGLTWADGSQGTQGLAPGVGFCGPG